MSIPENIELEKMTFKPFLKYKIGQVVFLKSDQDKSHPMTIKDYDLDDDNCTDYYVTWLNSQGKAEHESYPEECLTLKEQNNV